MSSLAQRLYSSVSSTIWDADLSTLSLPGRVGLRGARTLVSVVRDLADGQLTLRATSLVFTTLLSLVPLLAFTFSVLTGLGVHNQIEPLLYEFLAPLGERGAEISNRILEFVENIRVGVLGSIGLAMLIFVVLTLLHKIEAAFNHIWRLRRGRSIAQAFTQYLSVLLIGPLLMFSAMGITASLMSHALVQELVALQPLGLLVSSAGRLVPYVLVVLAFTLTYMFMPNTSVRIGAALTGALVGGALWQASGWMFGRFVVTSTQYTAIYSSFAILVLFMLWLYLSWLILLVGANIAYYQQHPESLGARAEDLQLSARLQEQVALSLTYMVARRYTSVQAAPHGKELATALHVPLPVVERVLRTLVQGRLLLETRSDPPGYVPAGDLARLTVREVLQAVRFSPQEATDALRRIRSEPVLDALVQGMDEAFAQTLGERTFADLVRSGTEQGGPELGAVSGNVSSMR